MKPLVISKTIEHNTDNNEQFQNDGELLNFEHFLKVELTVLKY